MITSRGCPYKCLFCARPHLGKFFRARSAKDVVDEMQQCSILMIIADEAGSNKSAFSGNGQIKELITQPIIQMEKKNMNVTPISNFARYLFFSNEDCPLQVEQSDRRIMGIELTGNKPSYEYFDNLADAFDDDSKVLKFVDYLKAVDISRWKPVNRVITQFYKEVKSYTIPMELQFLAESFYNSKKESKFVASADLHADFVAWAQVNCNSNFSISKIKFGRTISKYDGLLHCSKRVDVELVRGQKKSKLAKGFEIDISAFKQFCDSKSVQIF